MGAEARFVDVTYRGLKVALRARLTETSPSTGFVEVDAPLPVGTRIVLSEGGKMVEARVVGVVEQESAAKSPPGMRISWAVEVAPAVAVEPEPEPEAETAPEAAASEDGPTDGKRRRRRAKTQIGRP